LKVTQIGSLSGGEGTVRGVWTRYIDLKYRVELGFEKHTNLLPFPLSLRERAEVRGRSSSPHTFGGRHEKGAL
jgi:hypothetical protein